MLQHKHVICIGRKIVCILGQVNLDIHIFVVYDHDFAPGDVEQFHPVSIFTKGAQLACGGHAGCGVEGLGICKQRLAPFGKDMGGIAFWHGDREIGGDGNGFEGKAGGGLGKRRCGRHH